MRNFTLEELAHFSRNERSLVKGLLNEEEMVENQGFTMNPSDEALNNVLAFSKAYSFRKGKKFKQIELTLN